MSHESHDKKALELEFHWLQPVPRSSTMVLSNPPTPEESLDRRAEETCLFGATTDRRISSGHKIRMKTDDPVRRPLPSIKLLKLQWALQRLASLSIVAEIYNDMVKSWWTELWDDPLSKNNEKERGKPFAP
ncbi:hypothetical protein CDV55_100154 [Aspergillus turcosus]|nr:hypothetical protein CDV55_100154 [Aspergillus turcosus]